MKSSSIDEYATTLELIIRSMVIQKNIPQTTPRRDECTYNVTSDEYILIIMSFILTRPSKTVTAADFCTYML